MSGQIHFPETVYITYFAHEHYVLNNGNFEISHNKQLDSGYGLFELISKIKAILEEKDELLLNFLRIYRDKDGRVFQKELETSILRGNIVDEKREGCDTKRKEAFYRIFKDRVVSWAIWNRQSPGFTEEMGYYSVSKNKKPYALKNIDQLFLVFLNKTE